MGMAEKTTRFALNVPYSKPCCDYETHSEGAENGAEALYAWAAWLEAIATDLRVLAAVVPDQDLALVLASDMTTGAHEGLFVEGPADLCDRLYPGFISIELVPEDAVDEPPAPN